MGEGGEDMKKKTTRHVSRKKDNLNIGFLVAVVAIILIVAAAFSRSQNNVKGTTSTGYDTYGYNYTARLFNGRADGVDRAQDGAVWGDPTYAKDHLVMKWSKAWDDARFHGAPWTPDAWTDNEWNGKAFGGSGEVWHYKIVWVGPDLEKSPYWRPGGYAVWGEFEVIMDQGVSSGTDPAHMIYAKAIPAGYGANK